MLRLIKISIAIFVLLTPTSFIQQSTYDLEIIITGLRNTNGQVMISLSKGSKGFPHKNYYRQLYFTDFTSPQFHLTIKDIPKGNYALLHDEDNNGKMKKI